MVRSYNFHPYSFKTVLPANFYPELWVPSLPKKNTYTNWRTGEPNDGGRERCLHLRRTNNWSDAICTGPSGFICQVDPS